jgi:uncharacterized protein
MTTSVSEQIKILIELQKIDSQIYKLKKELATHPEELKRLDQEFEKKKVHAKAAEDELKAVQLKQKQREADLTAREEKISKLQSQLYQLKSNKEYSAMELEIKGMKADKSVLEEDILRMLDSVHVSKAALAREKEALIVEDKKHQEQVNVVKKQSDETGASLKELEEKRKVYTPNIEKRLLSQYERLVKGLEGLALVPVVNKSCGGCHINLPPQVINETQQYEKWIVCESCARLLYWPL